MVNFLRRQKVNVVGLLETRVWVGRADSIKKIFGRDWKWINNYEHSPRGRLWVGWQEKDFSVDLICKHEQLIHSKITVVTSQEVFFITFVYVINTNAVRIPLWQELNRIYATMNRKWLQ